MAKKEEAPKIILERIYNIPLRRETLKVPPFMKANKAVKSVREFISRHMKSDDISMDRYLNLKIWEHGAKNPPHHVNVNATKNDKGMVFVELIGAPKEQQQPKAEDKKEAEKKEIKIEKEVGKETEKESRIIKEAEFTEKPEEMLEKQVEEAKEERAEQAKVIEKEEIKELKKEHPKHHAPKSRQRQKLQEAHPTAPRSV